MKRVRDTTEFAVRGIKITNVQNPDPRRISRNTGYNQFRVCSSANEEGRNVAAGNTNFVEYREAFKLKTADIPKSAIETKHLRRIRESADIGDLRRLLESFLGGGDLREERGDRYRNIVMSVDASKLYEEFYQVHYDFLKDAVERMSLQ